MDAAFLNGLANHPEIRPFVGALGTGVLDLTPLVNDPRNFCLRVEHGAFLFVPLDPARYELHTMIAPEGRGAGVLPASYAAARFMFTQTDCLEIVTKVPASNRRADIMVRRVGFTPSFERPGAWEDGSDITFYAMTLDQWRERDTLAWAEGQAFHEALEAAKAASGATLPTHPEDPAHDRAAGLAMLMAKAGNYRKAVWSYSRWARLAGYQTIELLSEAPPLIDVRDALVTVRDGKMEVLQCR